MTQQKHEPEAEILEHPADYKAHEMNAQTALREYAAHEWPLVNNKGRIARLAKLLPHMGHRRVRAIYNGEYGVSLRAEEQAQIETLTAEAQHEFRTITALCQGLEALLSHTDEDAYRTQIDALRAISRGMGRPGNQG